MLVTYSELNSTVILSTHSFYFFFLFFFNFLFQHLLQCQGIGISMEHIYEHGHNWRKIPYQNQESNPELLDQYAVMLPLS